MIEIPEAVVLKHQLNEALKGKTIINVIANQSPHKFAWFHKDPNDYSALLINKTIGETNNYGGMVSIHVDNARIVFGDGVNLRYLMHDEKLPIKHQLHLLFNDESSLVASVQMYGGLWAYNEGDFKYIYLDIAKKKPNPLSESFTLDYFLSLLDDERIQKKSVKAFLATEQRIPGLGNGVLQDILWDAKIHPKTRVSSLTNNDLRNLYDSIKAVLYGMMLKGGRDTEKNLFGDYGEYKTILSKKTVGKPCPRCGEIIEKSNYLGGSIYCCPSCQKYE